VLYQTADQVIRDWAEQNTPEGVPDEYQPAVYRLHDELEQLSQNTTNTEQVTRNLMRLKCPAYTI